MSRIGKSSKSKSKSIGLKVKSSDMDESSNDEDSKMKSYITKQFKKFMMNANGKGFDKDRRESSSSQFKSHNKGRRMLRMVVNTLFPQDQSALGVKVSVI